MNQIFLVYISLSAAVNMDLQEQWAPSLNSHDPTPPLPLLNPNNQAMFFLAQ